MPQTVLEMYKHVWQAGHESEARGQKTKNLRNVAVVFDAALPILTSFKERKLNLTYCKKEWLWYLTGDRFNDSIEKHAQIWAKLKQIDGGFNSNYGQYIFADPANGGDSQFTYCYKQLRADRGSRRASIVLLKQDHLYPENTDTVCTYAINFAIEENMLHMTVMMRSNDVIWGFTNDAFCFQQLYDFMYRLLHHDMPELRTGSYTHFTNSLHVYERHYDMIQLLIARGMADYVPINVPVVQAGEVIQLVATKGQYKDGSYATWLHAE